MTKFVQLLSLLATRARAHEDALRVLSPNLHAALSAAASHGRARGVSGIARLLGLDVDYGAEIVQRLEALGFVHRATRDYETLGRPSGGAGKIQSVLLTSEGAQALLDHQDIERAVIERTLDDLPEGARDAFIDFLDHFGASYLAELETEEEEGKYEGLAQASASVAGAVPPSVATRRKRGKLSR